MDISKNIGQQALYIESGYICLATLIDVQCDADQITGVFEISEKAYPSCSLNRILEPGDDHVSSWLDEPPFGERWSFTCTPRDFYADGNHWDISFLWGMGGVRIFFHPEFIEAFKLGKVEWLSKFYSGDDDE